MTVVEDHNPSSINPDLLPDVARKRVVQLQKQLRNWLSKGKDGHWSHPGLLEAIRKTTESGFFTLQEITYQLESIAEQISPFAEQISPSQSKNLRSQNEDPLMNWVERVWNLVRKSDDITQVRPIVLCLHAGNIPLAGFQDVIAVLLAGFKYRGKLSRKDPWLLESLLFELQKAGFAIDSYSTDLAKLSREATADYLFFSGSENTLPLLETMLEQSGQSDPERPPIMLTRYASGSVAIVQKKDLFTNEDSDRLSTDLFFACSMYSGKGCRSVSTVLSEISLLEWITVLKEQSNLYKSLREASEYLVVQPDEALQYEKAYGVAKERVQFAIGPILYVDEPGWSSRPGIIHWIRSDAEEMVEYLRRHRSRIQSIFISDIKSSSVTTSALKSNSAESNDSKLESILQSAGFQAESLSSAQKPSIDWKPDQVDPLEWLLRQHLIPFFLF